MMCLDYTVAVEKRRRRWILVHRFVLPVRLPQKATWSLRLIFFQSVFGTFVPSASALSMVSLSLEDSVYAFLLSFELFWFATCLVPVPVLVTERTSDAVALKERYRSFIELTAVPSLLRLICFHVSKLG